MTAARIHTMLSSAPLSEAAAADFCADPAAGAVLVFTGVVRAATDGREVAALGYEAHPERAERQMAELAAEVAGRWPVLAVWM